MVYTQKPSGIAGGKFTTEPSVQNSTSKTQPSPPAAKPSVTPPPPAARSVSTLVAAAGLPADKLSASIVSFARFFSLPLKPELMAAMRRQALAPSTAPQPAASPAAENAPDSKTATQNREALSLAAAAAESKGVKLDPQGLEQFAEAIDPDWQKRQNPDERNRQRQRKNSDEREKENAISKTGHLSAADIKEMALRTAEENPLLALLNKLPGKNAQRWMVLPFSFDQDGKKYTVSLRILLETDSQISGGAVGMAVDIAESETGRRWLFVVNGPNRRGTNAAAGLTVYLQHKLSPQAIASFTRELSTLMEIPPERVSVKSRTESFPGESGCTDDWPLAVNEAV